MTTGDALKTKKTKTKKTKKQRNNNKKNNVGIVGLLWLNQHQHCVGGGGEGVGQKDHMLTKVRSVPRHLTRIVVQGSLIHYFPENIHLLIFF